MRLGKAHWKACDRNAKADSRLVVARLIEYHVETGDYPAGDPQAKELWSIAAEMRRQAKRLKS